jgi:thiamine biosynthesis lipoprotein
MNNFKLVLQSTLVAVFCVSLPLPVVSASLKLTGQTMGTYYSIVIDDAEESAASDITTQVNACLADVNRQMSTWDPESEISQFNQTASTEWFAVSREFAEVVQESQRIHKLTNGAFDPTVAPLIDLWGFGSKTPRKLPDQEEIDSAKKLVGMQYVEARVAPPAIRKTQLGISLNLSAIAKGHGVDRVSLLLTSLGFPSHVVDIGGENRAGTAKSGGGLWRLGVESPLQNSGGLQRVLEIEQKSVATSGDYRNYFEIDGVRYSHAVDPVSGRPVSNPPASISVIHESCMTADALATGLMVLGTEKGIKLARELNLSVLFLDVVDAPNSRVIETASGEFASVGDDTPLEAAEKELTAEGSWLPFVAALVIFLLAVTGMSIGVLLKNRELKGSCGGLASMPGQDGKSICELCTIPKDQCSKPEVRARLAEEAALQETANDFESEPPEKP